MIRRHFTALTALLLLAAQATWAHSHLVSSQPGQSAVLTTAPVRLQLTFNEPLRLTALSVRTVNGGEKEIKPLPAEAKAEHSVTAPALGAGRHEVHWRGVGSDGHVVNGVIRFSIAAAP